MRPEATWRRWRARYSKALAAVLVTSVVTGVTATPSAADSRRWAAIDAFVEERFDATGTPGAALTVIEGGQVVHERGFGEDSRGRAVTPDTPFLWGSVAKPLTGLAVLQLTEAGAVHLDAPVRTYLPWFRLADKDVSDRITVRHLLTNTSSIPTSATTEVGDRYDNSPGALSKAVRDLSEISPEGEPGESYAYSSAGYAVLGALVEEVSGRPFGSYLHEKILDPLGMKHAVASERDFSREQVPPGHRFVFDDPARFDAPYDTSGTPGAHMGGTARDLSRLVLAELGGGQLEGRRVLSAKGIAESQRGQVDSDADRFGLGWSVGTLEDTNERMVWKSGSLPGHDAMIVMLPDSGRAVIVLQNAFHLLRAQEFHDAAIGTAQLLSGAEPRSTPTDPLATLLPWAMVVLAGLLALCVVAPALRFLATRRAAAWARSRRRIVLNALASAAGSLALAALLWWVLPSALGGSIDSALLWLPDVGWAAIGVVALALVLAVERLLLGVVDVRRGRGPTERRQAGTQATRRAPSVPSRADNSGQAQPPETRPPKPPNGKAQARRPLVAQAPVIPKLRVAPP
ncbi:serine hydrolase domain-containing protein [Streptomyces sp. NPDC005794]|uniref:serine hydrolase domain-containing protein n=1 Tax=Streptomyces sp. NPDC005794 TaxID=3364733 RepID=UPI0036B48530